MDITSHLHSLGKRVRCKINAFGSEKPGDGSDGTPGWLQVCHSDALCYPAAAEPGPCAGGFKDLSPTDKDTRTGRHVCLRAGRSKLKCSYFTAPTENLSL